MARQWRIEYEGALYHVLSRGNEGRNIIVDDQDRACFLEALDRMCDRFEVEIYAYVVMDNHYYLLLRTNRSNLSKSMQWFGVTYTRRFNLRHGRSGHLFQGRFKSFLIENDTYLMRLSCYIHRNPLRAGIVDRLVDYRWSSYPVYAYGKNHPTWLNVYLILSQFNVKDKQKAYREEVQKYAGEETRIWEDVRHGLFVGTKEFIDRIKSTYLPKKPHVEIPQQRQLLKEQDVRSLLSKAAPALECNLKDFLQSSRITGPNKDNRDLLIYLLWETSLYTNKEIGDHSCPK